MLINEGERLCVGGDNRKGEVLQGSQNTTAPPQVAERDPPDDMGVGQSRRPQQSGKPNVPDSQVVDPHHVSTSITPEARDASAAP